MAGLDLRVDPEWAIGLAQSLQVCTISYGPYRCSLIERGASSQWPYFTTGNTHLSLEHNGHFSKMLKMHMRENFPISCIYNIGYIIYRLCYKLKQMHRMRFYWKPSILRHIICRMTHISLKSYVNPPSHAFWSFKNDFFMLLY